MFCRITVRCFRPKGQMQFLRRSNLFFVWLRLQITFVCSNNMKTREVTASHVLCNPLHYRTVRRFPPKGRMNFFQSEILFVVWLRPGIALFCPSLMENRKVILVGFSLDSSCILPDLAWKKVTTVKPPAQKRCTTPWQRQQCPCFGRNLLLMVEECPHKRRRHPTASIWAPASDLPFRGVSEFQKQL